MNRHRPVAIVSGALANKPFNGGNAWTRLSWVLGLRKLGFDAWFVEQISPANCVDSSGKETPFKDSVNLRYFRAVMRQFDLLESSTLVCEGSGEVYGLHPATLAERLGHVDLLFNISGHLTDAELKELARCKVYYDDDPGFTQFWHAMGSGGPRLTGHDFYFTIGENIGSSDCAIPAGNIEWRHTRPPVVLTEWPLRESASFNRFTTVASWRGAYAPVEYCGKTYRLKAHEFRKFVELPRHMRLRFEIALQIYPGDQKDLDALIANGWNIVDPIQVADFPHEYRRYIQGSGAEFSVAQGMYVDTNSGWFSDRTVRYLASGKPALVQDTGFSRHYPAQEGLVAFRTFEEAVSGAESITADYRKHCTAARAIAEEFFDSDKVIRRMASEIGLELR
jgi:hypothetical protein